MILHLLQNGSLPFNKFEFLVTWLFREVTSPYVFFSAQLNPVIRWRTKQFRLRWGGVAEPVGETKQPLTSLAVEEPSEKVKL